MSREDTRRRSRLIRRSAIFTTVVLAGVLYFERPAPAWKPGGLLEYWVSQAAHGRAGQVRIETGISLLNISNTISSVTIFSHDLIGTPLNLLAGPGDQATSSLGLTIPPGGTATVRSLNDDPDTINSGWYGIFSGNDKVLVQTEFSIFQLAFQSQEVQDNKAAPQTQHESLITRAQVPGRDLVQAGSFFVGSEGRIGVAALNPLFSVSDAELLLATVRAGGQVLDTASVPLAPGSKITQFLDEIMDTTDAASVEFRANFPIALLPLRQDGLILTTQDVLAPRPLQSLQWPPQS